MKINSIVKFLVITLTIGVFSPSIHIDTKNSKPQLKVSLLKQVEARGRKGNRGGNRNANRNVNRNTNRNRNVNRNTNRNVNVNRNVNRNVNVNVNHRHYGGVRSYGHYRGRPILAFTAGLAVGSIVAAASMPSSCTTVVTNNVTYRRCGNSYYQPFYEGDTVVYKVVASPY